MLPAKDEMPAAFDVASVIVPGDVSSRIPLVDKARAGPVALLSNAIAGPRMVSTMLSCVLLAIEIVPVACSGPTWLITLSG